jgi:hypothetical protein
LKILDALQLARHLPGERENGRVVATGLIEAGDEMGAAGPGCPTTHAEPPGKLCLACGRERLSIIPDDPPSKIFLARIAHFRDQPPAGDWSGVWSLTSK